MTLVDLPRIAIQQNGGMFRPAGAAC